jgi:serine/threonine protein kinase
MMGRLKQPIWIVPLAIAGMVAVVGWWGNARLRQIIEGQVTAELAATLNANVTSLGIWTTNQMKLANSLAEEPAVRILAVRILQEPPPERGSAEPPLELERFSAYFRPRLNQMGYEVAQLVNTNFIVVATSGRGRMGRGMPVSETHTNKFAELFASRQPVMITPFKPELLVQRRSAGPGPAQRGTNGFARENRFPNGGRPRRGDVTLMQVAAPIRDVEGEVRGALALIINPDKEFTRILSVARSGDSGETYAFDQTGLLISRSRFDNQLRELGLLDKTNTSSALNLHLRDPGGDLTKGFKPHETDAGARPLTRIVANAVEGEDGVDATPSRDYRGVTVVGAWRWLPQLGFGVATQIDAGEAYRPLRVLQLLFLILFLLLVLCAMGMFLFSYANISWRRRLGEAELKLKQLGQYTLQEKIGEGGMGIVYRAHHALMRRDTAVKLLLPDRADPASIQRFEREVCLTCQLTHPNTVQIYDYGHTPDGVFYYAMELLRGLNLHELVDRFGPTPEARVIHILAQVCESLAEAHARGLVHRDIKPSNIFLCERGGVPDCVKVLDFGLVREYGDVSGDPIHRTGRNVLEGTPWYMPPETLEDSTRSDPRSDIYAVGALGYYLLTGDHVFPLASAQEIYEKQLAAPPPPPSRRTSNEVSAELDQVLLSCLEKQPDRRPASAIELRALLLATPRSSDWTLEMRAAWWKEYESQLQTAAPSESAIPSDATVSIDFASRIQQP